MLDRKLILADPDLVKRNNADRGVQVDVDRFLELEAERRRLETEIQELNRRANEISRDIRDAADKEALRAEGKEVRQRRDALSARLEGIEQESRALHELIPNLSHPDAPIGPESASVEVGRGRTPLTRFDFPAADHLDLGTRLGILDFEAGARVSGHGFYFLKNEAVLLELALQQFAVRALLERGFTPMVTPDIARNEVLWGTGFVPRGPETQIYSIENTDLSLIATAEITLGGAYMGRVLDEDDLPILLCGVSHCFRTEAGAHGRASRGLYRVHQFTKVEMFVITTPAESDAMLETLRGIECDLWDALEIPYRVIDTATGDLGAPAYRKYDLEAWMPGRGESGEFGEVTSTSNCTDYQARRLNIRYRPRGRTGTEFVHTLNGTAVANSRAVVSILENYQEADGSVRVPEVLRPYLHVERMTPRG